MNKKNNRKGFTTVELVIVIAVIAILATVLIPTFSTLIGDATEAANKSDANSLYKSWLTEHATEYTNETVLYIVVGNKTDSKDSRVVYKFENNELSEDPIPATKLPCGSTVLGAETNDLPAGFSWVATHKDDDAEGATGHGVCDNCGAAMN